MAQTQSLTEKLVAEAHGKAFPNRVFDIAILLPLVTAIFGIIKACQDSRNGSAKEAMQRRDVRTRIALRRTINRKHRGLDRGEKQKLFHAALDRLDTMTDDEIDGVVQEAEESAIVLEAIEDPDDEVQMD